MRGRVAAKLAQGSAPGPVVAPSEKLGGMLAFLNPRSWHPVVALSLAVAAIAQAGDHEFAWRLIEQGLKQGVSPQLLRQFRELKSIPARERLLRAENWRTRFGDDASLMLTLADLCAEESLWGKAEEFYKLACKGPEAAQAHYSLARLYEQIGRADEAAEQFRAAATVALRKHALVQV